MIIVFALPYLLILLAAAVGGAGSLAVAADTLAAAVLSNRTPLGTGPCRTALEPAGCDAARTVKALSDRLFAPGQGWGALSIELLAAVEQTVVSSSASVPLRPSTGSRLPT